MNDDDIVMLVSALCGGGFFLAFYALLGFVAYTMMNALKVLPPEHHKLPPPATFLMLIPCVNIFAGLYVFTQVPKSFESYAKSRGAPVDEQFFIVGVVTGVAFALSIIPFLNYCTPFFAIAGLIFFMVKLKAVKAAAEGPGGGGAPGGFAPPPGGAPPQGGFGPPSGGGFGPPAGGAPPQGGGFNAPPGGGFGGGTPPPTF